MTVYGRQEAWEESPEGWPQQFRPTAESSSGLISEYIYCDARDPWAANSRSRLAAGGCGPVRWALQGKALMTSVPLPPHLITTIERSHCLYQGCDAIAISRRASLKN